MTAIGKDNFLTWDQFWVTFRFLAAANRQLWRIPFFVLFFFASDLLDIALKTDSNLNAKFSNWVFFFSPACWASSR